MKKYISILMLVLSISVSAQTETIDTAQFVCVYDYQCTTLDHEENPTIDQMQIAVQVGPSVTKSMPASSYKALKEDMEKKEVWSSVYLERYSETFLHMPTIWTGWPVGKTTIRDIIAPNEYEGNEKTPKITWQIQEDTITVNGYLCKKATTEFRGVKWDVCYTEEVPSTAGPWRLNGLPGLIILAKSEAHSFVLSELKQESSPITIDSNPEILKMKYKKILKFKNKVFSDKRYAKEPTFYYDVDEAWEKGHFTLNKNGVYHTFVNGLPHLLQAHVYQPLELE